MTAYHDAKAKESNHHEDHRPGMILFCSQARKCNRHAEKYSNQMHNIAEELSDALILYTETSTFGNDTATSHLGVRSVTVANIAKKIYKCTT
jgi:hypothetical protein